MLKYAFLIGVTVEWLFGPEVHAVEDLLVVMVRALVASAAAWLALEALRLPVRAVDTLDPLTAAQRAERVEQSKAEAAAAQAAADKRRRRATASGAA